MKTYILAIVITVLAWSNLTGQEVKHERSAYGGIGVSSLLYQSAIGNHSVSTGGLLGGDYRFFVLEHFGISAGLEFSFINAVGKTDHYAYAYMAQDMEGENFEFRTAVNGYRETQSVILLNIPIMLRYRGDPEKNTFYAAAGVKIGIPLLGRYKTTDGTISNSGYYAYEDYEYTEQRFMGFGTFPARTGNDNIKLNMAYMLALEAGWNWRLEYVLLYTGIYFDYGLNDIVQKNKGQLLVAYNRDEPINFNTGSLINSQYLNNGALENMAGKISPFIIGLKVGVTFGHGRRHVDYIQPDRLPVFE